MKRFSIALFISLSPLLLLAQGDNKIIADTINTLQEVIVTATRKHAHILSVPYSTNTIVRKQIDEFQYRNTPEALIGTTGVFIQKTNHGGGSPFVRGLTGNQALMMIDGIRLNNSTFRYGPNQYLNNIDVFTISKIEVAKGTGSVQYGSDALGGVVQVFTKEPSFSNEKKYYHTVIGKAVTQKMEYTGRFETQYKSEKFAFIAGYSTRNFGNLVGGDTTGKQEPSGYKEQAADIKLKWKLSDDVVVTVAHQYLRQSDVPLYHRVKLENFNYYFFDPQQRQLTYAKLNADGKNKWMDKISFIASYQNTMERRRYQKNDNINRFEEEDKVKTFGAIADVASGITKKWTANSGIEYYHDKVNSRQKQIITTTDNIFYQRGLYPDEATSTNFSAYSLHHLKYGKWRIEAGLRYNIFSINIPDTLSSLRRGDAKITPSSLVTNLALLYHINQQQSVYTSFSAGYRTPNIDDMSTLGLVDFRYEIPAYNLKPEKTYNTEIGYRFTSNKTHGSVVLFYMQMSDLITRVQVRGQQVGGYNVYTKQNSQQSFVRGAEFSFNQQLTKRLGIKTTASCTYGQNLSGKEPMRRIPPLYGRLAVIYEIKHWNLIAESLFAGKQSRLAQGDKEDNRIPSGGTPGWHVMNLYAGYNANVFSIRVGLQNIFNEDYRTHGSGINGVGRSGWLSVQFNF